MPPPNTKPKTNHLIIRRATALVVEVHLISMVLFPLVDALLDGGPTWHLADVPVFGALNLTVVAPLVLGGSFLFRDALFGGTSPGKRLVGLRVVRPGSDAPPTPWSAILRNVPLALPLLGWLVEFVAASRSPQERRIGDRLADTEVREAHAKLATLPWVPIFLGVYFGGNALRTFVGPSIAAWFQAHL